MVGSWSFVRVRLGARTPIHIFNQGFVFCSPGPLRDSNIDLRWSLCFVSRPPQALNTRVYLIGPSMQCNYSSLFAPGKIWSGGRRKSCGKEHCDGLCGPSGRRAIKNPTPLREPCLLLAQCCQINLPSLRNKQPSCEVGPRCRTPGALGSALPWGREVCTGLCRETRPLCSGSSCSVWIICPGMDPGCGGGVRYSSRASGPGIETWQPRTVLDMATHCLCAHSLKMSHQCSRLMLVHWPESVGRTRT